MTRPTTRFPRWRWQQVLDENDHILLEGDQSCYFNRLMDLGQPIEDNDAATKKYVDDNSGTGSGEINTASNLGAGMDFTARKLE
jgi:hypothetical protein